MRPGQGGLAADAEPPGASMLFLESKVSRLLSCLSCRQITWRALVSHVRHRFLNGAERVNGMIIRGG